MAISIRKAILLAINLVSTVFTLLTGLRENPLIVQVSGRYDHMRARLLEGTINYNIIREDVISKDRLTDLTEVGKSYRFLSTPRRSPENLAEDRSTCMRVNSINATMMAIQFDDFWGYGPRRAQFFLFSISAPNCHVANFKPKWYSDTCVKTLGVGDESKCHRYILDNFATLSANRVIQVGVASDFGTPGVPFLKCIGRPEKPFDYFTDLMLPQNYWAGGSYHLEVQTSRCRAQPLIRNDDWEWGLFKVTQVDKAADVVIAVDDNGWLSIIISIAYGITTVTMIVRGVLAAILRSHTARYLPSGVRFVKEMRFLKYTLPFMSVANAVTENENRIVTFKGASFMASDVWMNHWLYIALSILDSVASIRTTYVILQMGSWMLTRKANFENFVFMCSALAKVTWILCFLHSLLRFGCKLALRSLKSAKFISSSWKDKLEWYVDGTALFMSYKIYSILLCLTLYLMLKIHGSTTLMVRQSPGKTGVFGGDPGIAQFWGNEIICDFFVMTVIVLPAGFVYSTLLLLTKYRHITRNGVIKMLQNRYALVGWDVFVAIEVLGMDPFNPALVEAGVCKTSCSLGAVLQQLYTSGLSGHVRFAADYLFLDNGFSKEPPKFRYPIKRAVAMGLCVARSASAVSNKYGPPTATTDHTENASAKQKDANHVEPSSPPTTSLRTQVKSLFERKLRIVSEGYLGSILFVDESDPGRFVKSAESPVMEFEVVDALSTMTILDIKPLLGNEKKLRIR